MEGINDEEFIRRLEELKHKDIDAFMALALETLKLYPDLAVEDDEPVEHKVQAMRKILSHCEQKEDYESCAFLRDLQKRIEDGA
jgi:hypothetical protein